MTIVKSAAASKDQFIVRMPDGLRAKLKQLALMNRRSMNAELLLLIERGMAAEDESRKGSGINMA